MMLDLFRKMLCFIEDRASRVLRWTSPLPVARVAVPESWDRVPCRAPQLLPLLVLSLLHTHK